MKKYEYSNLEIFTGTHPSNLAHDYMEWLTTHRGAIISERHPGMSIGFNADTGKMIQVYWLYVWYFDGDTMMDKDPEVSKNKLKEYLYQKSIEKFKGDEIKLAGVHKLIKELLKGGEDDGI